LRSPDPVSYDFPVIPERALKESPSKKYLYTWRIHGVWAQPEKWNPDYDLFTGWGTARTTTKKPQLKDFRETARLDKYKYGYVSSDSLVAVRHARIIQRVVIQEGREPVKKQKSKLGKTDPE